MGLINKGILIKGSNYLLSNRIDHYLYQICKLFALQYSKSDRFTFPLRRIIPRILGNAIPRIMRSLKVRMFFAVMIEPRKVKPIKRIL